MTWPASISLSATIVPAPGAPSYCASKAAVVMFTKVLAMELASARINVNCIAPGFVRVDSEVSPLTTEYVETITRSIPCWPGFGGGAEVGGGGHGH